MGSEPNALPPARPSRRQVVRTASLLGLIGPGTAGLASCGGLSGSTTQDGVLRVAMSAGNIPFPTTPPNEGYEGYRFVGNNLYDALTHLDVSQGETIPQPGPGLASSWDVDPGSREWTFHLREGVRFHDGTPFDAEAVVFALDRVMDAGSEFYSATDGGRAGAWVRQIEAYRAADPLTVVITTVAPYAWLHWDLLHVYFPSPTVVREVGNEAYPQHATGTGPFRMTRYVDGEILQMSRHDDYWGTPALLSQLVLRPQAEAATRLASLQSGAVDWAEVPSPDALDQLAREGFSVELGEYPHGIMPRFNTFRAPFKDNVALRRAVNHAADREGTALLINDVGYPASQYVPEFHPHFSPDVEGFSYDPDRARSELAEAGYAPGELRLVMAYPTGGSGNMFPDTMMQKLQADLAAIGVELELRPLEWNVIISIGTTGLDAPQWDDIDILWASPAAGQVPSGYNSTFLRMRPGDKPNAAGMDNPRVDAAYALAAAEFDPELSDAHLRDMMTATVENADFLFWMHDLNLRVLSREVHGYVHPKSWWVDFTIVDVTPADDPSNEEV